MSVNSAPKQKAPGTKLAGTSPTRQEQLSKLLARKSGATIAQLQVAFGWQPYSARAAISALRKVGHAVERTQTRKGTVYRIVSEAHLG